MSSYNRGGPECQRFRAKWYFPCRFIITDRHELVTDSFVAFLAD